MARHPRENEAERNLSDRPPDGEPPAGPPTPRPDEPRGPEGPPGDPGPPHGPPREQPPQDWAAEEAEGHAPGRPHEPIVRQPDGSISIRSGQDPALSTTAKEQNERPDQTNRPDNMSGNKP